MSSLNRGFTLIELMIVIAVLGIIAAIAIPSFREQVAKSRRSDAVSAVGRTQLAMERWRATNPSYANSAVPSATYPAMPTLDYYTITITGTPNATSYTLTATPKGSQSGDRCGNLVFAYSAGVTNKSSSTSATNCGF